MGYLFIILTIISESIAVICMKLSNGFENKMYGAIAVGTYILSFTFLTLALKHLPVGITNAVWAGASTVLVAVGGIFIFKEQLNVAQWICLALIVVGIVGLNVVGKS